MERREKSQAGNETDMHERLGSLNQNYENIPSFGWLRSNLYWIYHFIRAFDFNQMTVEV